jgi:hypothetical protein
MQVWKTLYRLELGAHHLNPGRTKHQLVDSLGRRDFPAFKSLEICQYEDDAGFYLLYFPEAGPGTDTWHQSLDDALHQAEWEFGVAPTEWVKVADN